MRILAAICLALATATSALAQDALKVINVTAINTRADEMDPFVAASNQALVYATNVAGTFDIHASYRSSSAWSKGTALPGCHAEDADERSPFIYNTTVYFATNWIPDEKFKKLKNFDLKFSTQGRAPLELLGISTKEDELHPWIHQGKEFYFSRKTDRGWMQYVAKGPNPGPIGDAQPVGFTAGFHNATLAADGKKMYLEGPLDEKRTRLFVSERGKEGWSKPKPIVNLSAADEDHSDAGPAVSPDGRYLYFTSNRAGGQGGWDIYAVPTIGLKAD